MQTEDSRLELFLGQSTIYFLPTSAFVQQDRFFSNLTLVFKLAGRRCRTLNYTLEDRQRRYHKPHVLTSLRRS